MSDIKIVPTSIEETGQVSRKLLSWLNEWPEKPVERINFEYVGEDFGMALSTIQGAYKTRQYITGGYMAEYQFKIIYRLLAASNNDRLNADETLDRLAGWAASRLDKPDIGENRKVLRIQINSTSSLFERYEDGAEDHQVLMTLIYEVI